MIKLVIADDEYFIRARLEKIISDNRTNIDIVSLCEDGEDVIKCLSLTKVDLLLMDIKMISVTGLEVAGYIFENKLNTKIILLSGYNDFNFAVEAMRYGVFDYLTKPISEEALLESLDKCIDVIESSKNMPKDKSIALLSGLFNKENLIIQAKDISNVRPAVIKYMSNSDKESYANFIKENTKDILENYNATTLYKLIREILNSLDIKYHILQSLTLVQYMQENIFEKDISCIEKLEDILIEIGVDCMGLNTILTKEQLIGKQILEDIERNFSNYDYTVAEIANNIGKNPSYINTVFKKVYGSTIKQTLSDYRLEKAKKLLRNSNMKIVDIATECGYSDIFYFSKRYKAKFGYPPSEENLKL
jgi:hypothetical protein